MLRSATNAACSETHTLLNTPESAELLLRVPSCTCRLYLFPSSQATRGHFTESCQERLSKAPPGTCERHDQDVHNSWRAPCKGRSNPAHVRQCLKWYERGSMGAMTSAAWIPPISSAESAERSGFSKTASESLCDGAETWWEERE
jgi:hypothetical protein